MYCIEQPLVFLPTSDVHDVDYHNLVLDLFDLYVLFYDLSQCIINLF